MAGSTPIERAGLAIAGLGAVLVLWGYLTISVPGVSRTEFVPATDPAEIRQHQEQQTRCLVANIAGEQVPPSCEHLPMYAGTLKKRPTLFVIRDTIENYGEPLFDQGYQTPDLLVWWGARIVALGLFVWWFYEATLAKLFRWIRHGKADPGN